MTDPVKFNDDEPILPATQPVIAPPVAPVKIDKVKERADNLKNAKARKAQLEEEAAQPDLPPQSKEYYKGQIDRCQNLIDAYSSQITPPVK